VQGAVTVRIEPSSARYSIQQTFNGIQASVPARRNWFAVLFLCAWLGGWAVGELSAIGQLFHIKMGFFSNSLKSGSHSDPQMFLTFWLAMWTIGGAVAFASVVWMLFGREIIGIEGGDLIYCVEALGIRRTRAFASDKVARLRGVEIDTSIRSRRSGSNWLRVPALYGEGAGSVAFDYGARAYRVGVSLDEAEARLLIQQMRPWLPDGAFAG
jgi:hypothetical protein